MVDSTEGYEGRPVGAGLFPSDMVGVEGMLLQDLAGSYAEYCHALAGPFDPVKILALTGDVLQSVSTILSTIEQHTEDPGKARQ
ncbi:hypothetical protein [Arthrobacter sp. R4-81]